MTDPRLVVTFDRERVLYDGSFATGFEVAFDAAPGVHVVETAIHVGPGLCRRKDVIEAELAYSRFFGNFKGRLAVRAVRT